jgi:hypothetical protein
MAKPVFNPTQFELRNQLPLAVSEEQAAQIAQATSRVNTQLDWVAQILGWNGPNYWDTLATTVHQKRALLTGTFGVYNSYTLLPLVEIRTWEQRVYTKIRPNIQIGQRVIIGDFQTYVYNLETIGDVLSLDLGPLNDAVIGYLQQGAAIKVDCPENRPFPFYRPTAEASADAYFRCSVGATTNETEFYLFKNLVLSPFDQNNTLIPYTNLCLYGGSYYYFDRAVTISQNAPGFVPWIESQWVESAGLWEIFIPVDTIGEALTIIWDYVPDSSSKRVVASTPCQVIKWNDPSDWGNGGEFFNPVLDEYVIRRTYNVAGLNYSLGTTLWLGDTQPVTSNPLWYDAGSQILYGFNGSTWVALGVSDEYSSLTGGNAPPPTNYELQPGSIWQDPQGNVFVWDVGFQPEQFYYFIPTGIFEGFFYFDPTYQNVQGLYFYDPSNFYVHCYDYTDYDGLYVYNLSLNEEGFYVSDPCTDKAKWSLIDFYDTSLITTGWTPAYASNLFVLVNGTEIPNIFRTPDYQVNWQVNGSFLSVEYSALDSEGETFIPSITIGSRNSVGTSYIDISADFKSRPETQTIVPYNEVGVLNNFRGAWGNKGGARSMDFVFDALDIHGYNEQQALVLKPVAQVIDFDFLLNQVSGASVYVGESPPPNAKQGDYYWNNETGAMAVYYQDKDRNFVWLEVNYPISPCLLGSPDCDYFPLRPFLSSSGCVVTNGDTWQDPNSPGCAIFYDSPNSTNYWVEFNWNSETGVGWEILQYPNPVPDFNVLDIFLTDDFIKITRGEAYTTDNYTFYYTVDEIACTFTFFYTALSPLGVQQLPKVWVGINSGNYPFADITENVFSNAQYFLAPAVQNAETTLRPWKTQSLEVTDEEAIFEDTYENGLRADINLGPGDENWTRSFVRMPSEYGRNSKVWNQSKLVMQDFAYAGSPGNLKNMRCPSYDQTPQIYEQVVFEGDDPAVGTVLFSAPYLYSDASEFNNILNFFPYQEVTNNGFYEADFDYTIDAKYDEWDAAEATPYDPLHFRTTLSNGDWEGVYLEPTGNRQLTGSVERDLRVKTVIPVPPPAWDASIYKYPPLCPQSQESYVEDTNNYKVTYAYFAADLSASEDGFFDQSQDVSWREPLEKDQTLYILNS